MTTDYEFKYSKKFEDISDSVAVISSKLDNSLFNQKESIEVLKREIFEFKDLVENKLDKKIKEMSFDSLDIDKKIIEKYENIKNENNDFKKFFLESTNIRLSELKETITDDFSAQMKKLSNVFDDKIDLMKKDDKDSKIKNDIAAEGRIQGYIIESEKRIQKVLEERINNIQKDVEKLNIKVNVG